MPSSEGAISHLLKSTQSRLQMHSVSVVGWQAWALTSGLLVLIIYRLFFHPLAHIPGPLLARLSGWWRTYRYFRGTWHDDILEIHRKYGAVVRIAPNELSVVDAHATKQLYGHGHNTQKTTWYQTWEVASSAPGLFSTQDKRLHAHLRKRVSGAYSMSAILKFEKYIQDCLDLMLCQLKKHAEAGNTVNMSEWTNALAFDIVGELAYGAPLGHLQTETDVMGLRKAIFGGFFMMANFGHLPGQSKFLTNSWANSLMSVMGIENPLIEFRQWSTEKVRSRTDNIDAVKRDDMLAHFIGMKNEKNERVSFEEILMEALGIM